MKFNWRKFLQKLKNPSGLVLWIAYVATALSIGGAIGILFLDYEKSWLSVVAYALFAAAAITLAYTVYTIVLFFPKWKEGVKNGLQKNAFTGAMMRDYGFRTVIFAIGSFTLSIAYGAFNGVLGIMEKSIWYGALAAYYVFLAVLRGGMLVYHRRKRSMNDEDVETAQAFKYRNCGWVLLMLNIVLSSAIAQMIFDDQSFSYPSWTIYAYAAYAFYKVTMSIYNVFKAKSQDDLTIEGIRAINLVAAAVSVLALKTALLHTFGKEGMNISVYNTLAGSVVSCGCIVLSVFMIVRGNKRIKELRKEKGNE